MLEISHGYSHESIISVVDYSLGQSFSQLFCLTNSLKPKGLYT